VIPASITCTKCGGRGCVLCRRRGEINLTLETVPMPATPATTSDDDALISWAASQTWSGFAVDVAAKARRFGGLTPRQREALLSMKAKLDARDAAASSPAPRQGVPGFAETIALLDHIDASGNKWPTVRLSLKASADDADDRRLKIARWQRGPHAGVAGIELEGAKLGVIDRSGVWTPSADARALPQETKRKVWAVLSALAADARGAFAANGKKLGVCACCSRPLSDQISVARGIGPECWEKLGMGA
jgi:hypothetical protein